MDNKKRVINKPNGLSMKHFYVFSGQGAQVPGMGRDLYEASAGAKAVFDAADAALGYKISDIIFNGPAETLTSSIHCQCAIYTMSCAALAAFREKFGNLSAPVACAGLSLGEYAALHAAGDSAVDYTKILDHLLAAHTMLMKENASNEDIIFELSPDIAGLLLKAKIETATDNSEQLEKGCLGYVAGCKVYVTNDLPVNTSGDSTTYTCIARTKRSIAFAEQISEVDAYRPELRFADAVKGLHLYGAKVVYPNEMVQMTFQLGAYLYDL